MVRTFEPFTGYFNKKEYLNTVEDEQYVMKFSILDYGKEVASKMIDLTCYPRFVRNNINISNSVEKYVPNENCSQLDAYMMSVFRGMKFKDLIPIIVREICKTCSYAEADDYESSVTYGDTEYGLSIGALNYRYMKKLERLYAKKTEKYFKNIG